MKLNIEREIVQRAVRKCLNEIIEDIDNGSMGKTYLVKFYVDREIRGRLLLDEEEVPITRPEILYNLVYDLGIAAATESFTDDLLKKIYGKI